MTQEKGAEARERVYPWLNKLAGDLRGDERYEDLGEDSRARVAKALDGLEKDKIRDLHCHVVGIGTGGTGNRIGPKSFADGIFMSHPGLGY
jgi:hypothetical protein